MVKDIKHFYEFGPFQIDIANGLLLRDREQVSLTPKAFELLLVLVENAGEVIGNDSLLKLVWPDTNVGRNIVSVNMATLRKALGDGVDGNVYIITVPKRGYQFVATVRKVITDPVIPPKEELRESSILDITPAGKVADLPTGSSLIRQIRLALGDHFWHALASCSIYASHYMIALLLEVAYKFDIYGTKALITAPLFFCWILATSIWGLVLALKATGKSYGLVGGGIVFVVAAVVAFGGAWLVLPNIPITEAEFQTYAAPAAYLKDIAYILPIALLFLIVPFHFVAVLEHEIKQGKVKEVLKLLSGSKLSIRPAGTIYIKTWVLGLLLAGWLAYSLPARAHLFDHLRPSPYLSLFGILHQTRTMLQFALGFYCLAWYYWALNRLKSKCIVSLELLRAKS
jgi:DNA-binding winged helix-turn-helix (wHTH) protein